MNPPETITLFRPVGQKELDLIEQSGWKEFPPRLFWQPIFYPVLTEEYAIAIARDWNTKGLCSAVRRAQRLPRSPRAARSWRSSGA
jgi:hypothetical protein